MAITAADLKFYLSGGASNTDPQQSLGGAISDTQITSPSEVLWDYVHYNEAYFGDEEYRCIYLKNTHSTDSILDLVVYVGQGTLPGGEPAPVTINVAFDPAGVGDGVNTGVAEGPLASEDTPPTYVVFPDNPPGDGDSAIGHYNLRPGEAVALWIKRTLPAGTTTSFTTTPTIQVLFGV